MELGSELSEGGSMDEDDRGDRMDLDGAGVIDNRRSKGGLQLSASPTIETTSRSREWLRLYGSLTTDTVSPTSQGFSV